MSAADRIAAERRLTAVLERLLAREEGAMAKEIDPNLVALSARVPRTLWRQCRLAALEAQEPFGDWVARAMAEHLERVEKVEKAAGEYDGQSDPYAPPRR